MKKLSYPCLYILIEAVSASVYKVEKGVYSNDCCTIICYVPSHYVADRTVILVSQHVSQVTHQHITG